MPNWKKLIVSGSDATLNSINVISTGSFGDDITITSGSFRVETFTEGLQFYNGSNYTTNRITLTSAQNMQFRTGNAFQFTGGPLQILAGNQLGLKNSDSDNLIRLKNTGASGQGKLEIQDNSNNLLAFISSSGNVGIGTATSSQKLRVQGNFRVDSGYLLVSNGAGNTTEYLYHNPTSKAVELNVTSSNTTFDPQYLIRQDGVLKAQFGWDDDGGKELFIVNAADGPIQFKNSTTEHARITNTGFVGIGTTSPDHRIHLSGSNVNIKLEGDGSAGAPITSIFMYRAGVRWSLLSGTGGANRFDIRDDANSASRFTLNSAGKLTLGSYGSGTHTGTAAYNIQVDSSGNVIETAVGGALNGSGAAKKLAIWADADTLTSDSELHFDGLNNNLGISTSSPARGLHIVDSDDTIALFESSDAISRIEIKDSVDSTFFGTADGVAFIGSNSSGTATQNLRINADGHIGIGMTPNIQYGFGMRRNLTLADQGRSGFFVNFDLTGNTALSSDRTYSGFNVDMDSDATGGNQSQELILRGFNANVRSAGDANDVYGYYSDVISATSTANNAQNQINGGYFRGLAQHSDGLVSNIRGATGEAMLNGATSATAITNAHGIRGLFNVNNNSTTNVSNAYAGFFKSDFAAQSTGTSTVTGTVYGVYGEIESDSTTSIANARVIAGFVDANSGSQFDNAYQFYGSTSINANATINNSWGIYSIGASKHRLDGNVGIGTDSPATKLHVEGFARLNGGLQLAGSNRYVYAINNTSLLLGTNNTERMRIDSSGNVGIGTTAPVRKLHVEGNSGGNELFLAQDTNSTLGTLIGRFKQNDGTNNPFLNISSTSTGMLINTGFSTGIPGSFVLQSNGGSSYLAFNTNGANERMRIDSSGNVGIGTSSPAEKLDVSGNIRLGDAGSGANIDFNATERGVIKVNGTERMRISGSGNVGIGTTSPDELLHVEGSNGTIQVVESGGATVKMRAGSVGRLGTYSNNDLSLVTNSTDQVRITSAGKVGIGTTTPSTTLDVNGDIALTGSLIGDANWDIFAQFTNRGRINLLSNNSADSNIQVALLTDGNQRLTIEKGGTTNILSGLDVTGDTDIAGNLTFSGAARDILIVDNDATALEIKEGSNLYMRFNSTNGAENILLHKATSLSSTLSVTGNINVPDDSKLILGTGNDLQLYHDSTSNNSIISEGGTGILSLRGTNLRLQNAAGTKSYLRGENGGATTLFHDNSVRLATTAAGVDITGDMTVSGKLTAQEFHTEFVSASIIYDSGSTKFGDTEDDVHDFTGSLNIFSGSFHLNPKFTNTSGLFKITHGPIASDNLRHILVENTGSQRLFRVSTDSNGHTSVDLANNGTERVRIGTYWPTYINNGGYSTRGGLLVGTGSYTDNYYGLAVAEGGSSGSLNVADTLYVSGSRVGIGTATPGYNLHNTGTSRLEGRITLGGNVNNFIEGSGTAITFKSNNDYSFTKGAATLVTIKDSGKVGIGTTTPAEKLTVEGNISSSGQLNIATAEDTVAIFESTDQNSNVVIKDSNATSKLVHSLHAFKILVDPDDADSNSNFRIEIDGDEALRIKNNRNVGIGTSNPESRLHITDANPVFIMEDTSNPNKNKIENVDGNMRYHADYNSDMGNSRHIFFIDNSEKVRFDTNGNVGIGTTSPEDELEVFGDFRIRNSNGSNPADAGNLFFAETNGVFGSDAYGFRIHQDGSNNRLHFQGGAAASTVDNILVLERDTGDVGIGTANPDVTLHVESADETVARFVRNDGSGFTAIDIKDGVGTTGNSAIRFSDTGGSPGEINYEHADNSLRINTNGGERLRIASNGNVGIGTTTPRAALHIVSSSSATGTALRIDNAFGESDKTIEFVATSNNTSGNVISSILAYGRRSSVAGGRNPAGGPYLGFQVWNGPDASLNEVGRFTTSGSFGIGTIEPRARLHISGSTAAESGIRLSRAGVKVWSQEIDSNGKLQWAYRSTEGGSATQHFTLNDTGQAILHGYGSGNFTGTAAKTLAVDSSGNIIETDGGGSGTVDGSGAANRIAIWSDSDTLTSNSALTFTGGHILVNQGTEYRSKDTGGSVRTLMRVNGNNELEYGWSANGPVKFMGGGSYAERMRIHTNGNVGIGSTSPGTTLDVLGSFKAVNDGAGGDSITTFQVNTHGNIVMSRNHATSPQISTGFSSGNSTLNFIRSGTTFTKIECDNSTFSGSVGIAVSGSYTANTLADDLVIGNGVGSRGMSIFSAANGSGAIHFADDLDTEGAGDSPAGNRDGVIRYSHSDSNFSLRTGGNQTALTLSHTSAAFTSAISGQTLTLDGSSANIPLYVRSTGTVSYVQIQNSSTGYGGSSNGLTVGNNNVHGYVWNRETGSLYLGTKDTTALHLDSSQVAHFAEDVKLADNKKLKFGAAHDYEIYHNSSTNVNHISSLLDRQLSLNANIINLTNQANSDTVLTVSGSRVGIGTTTPDRRLEVENTSGVGEMALSGTTGARLYFRPTTAYSAGGNFGIIVAGTNSAPYLSTMDFTGYNNGVNTIMTMKGDGKVGVGTTTPDHLFHVEFTNTDTSFSGGGGGAWGSEGIRIENTSATANTMAMLHLRNNDADIHIAGIRQGTDDSDLGFFFEGTERVRFTKSGHVGIGTNNPGHKLAVIGGNIQTDGIVYSNTIRDNTGGNVVIQDNGGNVGIGTTSPTYKLDVQGTTSNTNVRVLTTTGNANYRLQTNNSHFVLTGVGAANQFTIYDSNASAVRQTIESTGKIRFNSYGSATHTGTPAKTLQVDSNGNIIEGAIVNFAPKVEYQALSSDVAENTTFTLPNSLSYTVSSGGYEYLEIFLDGIRLMRGIDFEEISTTQVKILMAVPSGSVFTYKSIT